MKTTHRKPNYGRNVHLCEHCKQKFCVQSSLETHVKMIHGFKLNRHGKVHFFNENIL